MDHPSPCPQCEPETSGGRYEHVHRTAKIPRRWIANRQWVRQSGWAVGLGSDPAWLFFDELDAAVVFARAADGSDDAGPVLICHAYTEWVFSAEPFTQPRRFLGIGSAATRCLTNDRLIRAWTDRIFDQPDLEAC
jgi:hypothetical protein